MVADSYQRDIAEGLSEAFDDERTVEVELDLDSARVVIFSDHHKGARDGADDFWRCERAYHAALGYYLEAGHQLIVLGDVEEWECTPEEVLNAYPETLALEAEFHKQGRCRRFWGNHDDQWAREGEVDKHLVHDTAMFAWARGHPAKPVLIAGHTHRPVFGTSKPPPVMKRERRMWRGAGARPRF
jgi:hypothetical protein